MAVNTAFRKLKTFFIGGARDFTDHKIFHQLALSAFLAWVGLGSDGLSSSCYFMVKKAPVSRMESVMDYIARFDATACGRDIDFVLTVKANVTTLCPCSRAIAKYGAHNQRGEVTVAIRMRKSVWIEDLVAMIESSASSELYALLKRQDEKFVTEHAYENPVFVEDLVRNVALKLNAHPRVTWYKVEAENFESIHNHNAYACIEKR